MNIYADFWFKMLAKEAKAIAKKRFRVVARSIILCRRAIGMDEKFVSV